RVLSRPRRSAAARPNRRAPGCRCRLRRSRSAPAPSSVPSPDNLTVAVRRQWASSTHARWPEVRRLITTGQLRSRRTCWTRPGPARPNRPPDGSTRMPPWPPAETPSIAVEPKWHTRSVLNNLDDGIEVIAEPGRGRVRLRAVEKNGEVLDFHLTG